MKMTDVFPNLVVSDIDKSAAFYRDVLGFTTVTTVPDEPPFVFVWLQRDDVSVFLNAREGVAEDLPEVAARQVGGTAMLFITVDAEDAEAGVDAVFKSVDRRARVLMPLKDQFYGMREFAIADPDGYVIIFAQRTSA
jgi:lactoylglutathione lyase